MSQVTLKIKAYDTIKSKIINCELMPGDYLDEKLLMDEIGSSRTPIREALSKLEHENLVKIIPKKGIVITNLTITDVIDVYDVREFLEPLILEKFQLDIDKTYISDIKNRFIKFTNDGISENYDNIIKIDNEFHGYIISLCNNKYLISMFNEIEFQNDRIRIISGKLGDRLKGSIDEHLEIIDCILEDDFSNATKKMHEHILNAKKVAIDSYINGKFNLQ